MDIVSYLLGKKAGGGGGDMSNYYTKSEVNALIPPIYVLETTNQLVDNNGGQTLENEAKTRYGEILTDALAKGYKDIAIMLCSTTSGKSYMLYSAGVISTTTSPYFYSDVSFFNKDNVDKVVRRSLNCSGSWSNNIFTPTGAMSYDVETRIMVNSLNQEAYTVNNNYQPAHKKYVDDSIAAAIGNALEGSY